MTIERWWRSFVFTVTLERRTPRFGFPTYFRTMSYSRP